MTRDIRMVRSDEPLAVELTAVAQAREVDRLRRMLAADPWLTNCVVENPTVGAHAAASFFGGQNASAALIGFAILVTAALISQAPA